MKIHREKVGLALLALLLFATAAGAQQTTISGAVRDMNTHREISDVNIVVQGTRLGTSSDFAGRFILRIPGATHKMVIVFQHIAYEPREIPLDSAAAMYHIDLQPRVIPFREVRVEAPGQRLEIERDLPQTVSLIEARNFEIRGYVDAGDLLRTDHSVQVEEELSGKKTAAIRGGNADEVVVLYNGVKMNSAFDNVFDLSLIDLEDIDRFEIIKGSNTALYGPEAFSGVINIVPKVQQDYNIRFQQRFGTYRSGNWGLHLYEKFKNVQGSYSFKRGGATRNFVDLPEEQGRLENTSRHHTANLSFGFAERADGSTADNLSVMYVNTSLDYNNQRDVETLANTNQLLSFKFTGNLFKLEEVDLSVSLRQLNEEQSLASSFGALNRGIEDRTVHINAEKRLQFTKAELLLAYQFQNATLDFADERRNFQEQAIGLEAAEFHRRHHGLVAIGKYHGDAGSEFFRDFEISASLRHDRVNDEQTSPVLRGGAVGIFNRNQWQSTMFKLAFNFSGYRPDLTFNGHMSFGRNTKFPTLFQQISSPLLLTRAAFQPSLNPEGNSSIELGFEVIRDLGKRTGVYGVQFSGSFFQNHYDNKFRVSTTPGIPVTFYDNVGTARISGLETRLSVYLLRKKLTLELGASRYFIDEKAAFPFKSDHKITSNLIIDHAGYSFQIHWFQEGEQIGLLRETNGRFALVSLPQYTNLDLHLSKTFEMGRFKLFANASGRNLIREDEVVLRGLALRDRRFYVTFGAQY